MPPPLSATAGSSREDAAAAALQKVAAASALVQTAEPVGRMTRSRKVKDSRDGSPPVDSTPLCANSHGAMPGAHNVLDLMPTSGAMDIEVQLFLHMMDDSCVLDYVNPSLPT